MLSALLSDGQLMLSGAQTVNSNNNLDPKTVLEITSISLKKIKAILLDWRFIGNFFIKMSTKSSRVGGKNL